MAHRCAPLSHLGNPCSTPYSVPKTLAHSILRAVSHHLMNQSNPLIYKTFGVAQCQWLTPIELLV